MRKLLYTAVAALSLVTTSTMAVAAMPMSAPVVTPLTQPASEKVSGDNQFVGISGIGAVFGVVAVAALIATVVFAVKSGDKGNNPPVIRTSP